MATMITDCPHCGASRMAFTLRGEYQLPGESYHRIVFGQCNGCNFPITARLINRNGTRWDPTQVQGDIFKESTLQLLRLWPEPSSITAPESVPEKVGRNFIEAAEARRRQSWNAACGMYRRTMEIALKEFAPDIEAWKLEKRIDKLAAEHRITPDIQNWAHELRLDGNEALHGEDDADQEMADQMHHLTHFLLVYLYTLPAEIDTVRDRRANGGT